MIPTILVYIYIYPNGYSSGEGTHVSVYLPILKGNNDDKMSWPFIGTVRVDILNQLEDRNHKVAILTFKEEHNARVGSNWGWAKFIPHSLLSYDPVNNTQYLKDDTLYFRVSVEVEGHKPWLECTVLTQEEIVEEIYYTKAQIQSVMNTIASNNATIVKLKKENEDMAVKLQSATAMFQSAVASMKKENAAMAAQWKKEKDDMALKFHNMCTTMKLQSAIASMKAENNAMIVGLKKDMAVKLQSATDTTAKLKSTIASMKKESAAMAVQWRNEMDDMALKLQSATDITVKLQLTIASMKTKNAAMEDQLKKENEDTALKLQSAMSTIASLRQDLMTFKLSEFGKKVINNEAFHSKSFYSTCGYNISIAVYPNGHGDGKGTHVSLFAHIVEGDYDNQLKWPFIGTVKVELLNQLEDKNHNETTLPFYKEDNTRVVGYDGFISHSQLSGISRKIQYLRGDTLYFRVSVSEFSYKPWLKCNLK